MSDLSPAELPLRPARRSRSARRTGSSEIDPYNKLFEERIIFLGVQIDDASANDVMAQLLTPGVDGPRPRHLDLHQLARRLVHRADGDLRHDAVRPAGHPDDLPGPGGLGRGGPARRRHAGQALRAAELADPHPPAVHRGRRPGQRHRDPGPRDPADARRSWRRCSPSTPTAPPEQVAGTSSATRSSPPRRPWSTAWSTRSLDHPKRRPALESDAGRLSAAHAATSERVGR